MDNEGPKLYRYTKPCPTWKPLDGVWVTETTINGQHPHGRRDRLIHWVPPPIHIGDHERALTDAERAEMLGLFNRVENKAAAA